jgi:hypothetical protein
VGTGVTYSIAPGSKDADLPRTAAAIQTKGRALFGPPV